ncbi:hypothetical protein B0H14DRAFT_3158687 [Mycena olivaceomarginata]|nr:hypothetical protein B0H14DRAFT_3158687 [Mycena olivaceomarginata]
MDVIYDFLRAARRDDRECFAFLAGPDSVLASLQAVHEAADAVVVERTGKEKVKESARVEIVGRRGYCKWKKRKTTWNTRRGLSDERRGDEDNGANPQHVPAKNNGDERKSKNNRRKAQPQTDDDEQLQNDEEQPRAPHNYAGGAWRYRARVDIVRGQCKIAFGSAEADDGLTEDEDSGAEC